jgi:hypothetical protein
MENKLKELVFKSLGEATMCWEPQPSIQVFDSTRAMKIGEKLINDIMILYAAKNK